MANGAEKKNIKQHLQRNKKNGNLFTFLYDSDHLTCLALCCSFLLGGDEKHHEAPNRK